MALFLTLPLLANAQLGAGQWKIHSNFVGSSATNCIDAGDKVYYLTKGSLYCYDKQQRKGIIITMGDEPLNPYLPAYKLNDAIDATEQADIETRQLYQEASQKFDIFHIAVDSPHDSYRHFANDIATSFGKVLGLRYRVSGINGLAGTIESCINESVAGVQAPSQEPQQQADGIRW